MGFNKLNFTLDRQDLYGNVCILFKTFMSINFHFRALVGGGGAEQEEAAGQLSAV